ncbi:MAG TPA: tetratricopeptide repeat protein [Burkholderiaceae bacterium]|nr:tetratricopeptide repeat protein [Burkholderiaceae bacterium]
MQQIIRKSGRLGRMVSAVSVAAGLGLVAPAMPGHGPAQAQEAVRAEVGKPLQAARDLYKQGKYKEALAKLREAEAVPNRTAQENQLIEQMRAAIASQAGDTEQAIKASLALINSGKLSEADRARHAASLASLYYRNKDFANAAKWADQALKANPGDPTMRSLLIQSNYQAGDLQAASREALEDVQAAEKAGRAPPEDRLQLLANVASKGSDRGAYVVALERLITYYPKKEYWADLLRRIESKPGFSNRLSLDVYRLRIATKTIETGNDYSEAAQLALQAGQAAEAKKILDEGFAAGLLGKGAEADRQKRLLNLATQRATDAPKDLATAESEATEDGNALVRIGMAYTGLGQYDKGIALMLKGLGKSNLKNIDDARLHLGIAYLRAGNRAKAVEAFRTVKGTDGAADLARLWTRVGTS